MKTFITFLLVLAIVICFLPNDSWGQEKSQEQNSIQKNVQSDKDIENRQVITSALPINNEIIRISEPPINAPLATRTASVSGNWSSTLTWGGSTVPTSSDNVTINSGITVTIDITNAQCASLTMPQPSRNQNITLNVNTGTIICGSLTLNGSSTNRMNIINITTGTMTVTGDISAASSSCQIIFTGSGTLNLGGTLTGSPTITTVSGCNVNYTGTSAQNIYPITYQGNLGLSGAGTKTISNIYVTNTVTVLGNLNNSSTLVLTAGTSLTNTWLIMRGNATNSGTITSTGAYTRFYFGSANAQTFANNGTVTASMASFDVANTNASGLTLTGNNFSVTRANLFYGTVINSNKITLGNGGTSYAVVQRGVASNANQAGNFDVSPAFNVGSGGLYLIYDYANADYDINKEIPPSGNVYYMVFYPTSARIITLSKNVTITNTLEFASGNISTFAIGANTLSITGTILYTSGTFLGGGSSNLTFSGTSAQSLPVSIGNGLNNLTINNAAGVALNAGVTVYGYLYLTNGNLSNGANLTMANGSTVNRADGTLSLAPAFGTSVNLIYSGTNPITTGVENPVSSSVLNNLTINNTGGITLGSNTTVNGSTTSC